MSIARWASSLLRNIKSGLYGIRTHLIELRDRETATPSSPTDHLILKIGIKYMDIFITLYDAFEKQGD